MQCIFVTSFPCHRAVRLVLLSPSILTQAKSICKIFSKILSTRLMRFCGMCSWGCCSHFRGCHCARGTGKESETRWQLYQGTNGEMSGWDQTPCPMPHASCSVLHGIDELTETNAFSSHTLTLLVKQKISHANSILRSNTNTHLG